MDPDASCVTHNDFELPGDDVWDITTQEDSRYKNMCPDCHVPMLRDASELSCPQCKRTESADITVADALNSTKRNWSTDPDGNQRYKTLRSLENFAREHTGDAIPHDVLDEVAGIYHEIQQKAFDEEVVDGEVRKRRFVRRGNNKDQILAYLIYAVCCKKGIIRSQECIKQFMKLKSPGFSQGEKEVRLFQGQGIIKDICVVEEPVQAIVARYFELLKIDITYSGFICEIVELANRKHIGNSKLASKLVGAIWMLIQQTKMKITTAQVEKATDTKKTTYMNFYNDIKNNMPVFKRVFDKHGIIISCT